MFQSRAFLHRAVWLFTAGCMAGFLLESAESLFSLGYVQNRQGMLYGPFTPVYGVGVLAFAACWPILKKHAWPVIFAVTAAIGAVLEYLWSWMQEALFGTLFWDYEQLPFNLNGRVNLLFTLFWGLLGLLFLRGMYRPFCVFMASLPRRGKSLVTWSLLILLAGDIALSVGAFSRQKERMDSVTASSPIQIFLDETYPDDWMREKFPNMMLRENG